MARRTCHLSSRHMCCLVSVLFTAFLIQSNESLVPLWGTRCINSQAVSGRTSDTESIRYLPTAFFRVHKSSTAIGSNSENEGVDTSTYFFANKDTDESGAESTEDAEEKAAEEAKAAEAEKAAQEKAEQEREAEQARLDKIAQQAKLEEEVRIAEEEREKMIKEWTDKTVESVEKVIKPFSEIQDGVPAERIKGAAIAATALTFLASKGVVASGAIGLSAAYLSISKSVAGDFLRTVGGVTWDAAETASKLADQFGVLPTFGEVDKTVVNKYKRNKPTNVKPDVDEGELAFIEAEDDDLARVLREAESVISEADAAIAKAEAEADIVEEAEEEEEEADEEEEEEEIDEDEMDEKGDLEADEVTDEDEMDEEGEEVDEDNDMLFDDDQFMAAVELAQEGIEGKIVGVDDIITDTSEKAEWDAAGELANELRQDSDPSSEVEEDEDDFDEIDLEFEDIDVEALAKAAREAVETFESEQQEVSEAILDEKQEWADSMVEQDDDDDDDFDFEDDEDLFSSDNLDETARAARAAVEASVDRVSEIDTQPSEKASEESVTRDWSSLKVVELKQELKKRGLKTSGKKAELVSLLEESDLEDSMKSDDDDDEVVDFEDFDIEELGRQARAAVEMFQTGVDGFDEEPTEEMLAELESEMNINGEFLDEPKASLDLSKMTVAQLKEECRNRGLKVGGKKAELIERLENASD